MTIVERRANDVRVILESSSRPLRKSEIIAALKPDERTWPPKEWQRYDAMTNVLHHMHKAGEIESVLLPGTHPQWTMK